MTRIEQLKANIFLFIFLFGTGDIPLNRIRLDQDLNRIVVGNHMKSCELCCDRHSTLIVPRCEDRGKNKMRSTRDFETKRGLFHKKNLSQETKGKTKTDLAASQHYDTNLNENQKTIIQHGLRETMTIYTLGQGNTGKNNQAQGWEQDIGVRKLGRQWQTSK